MFSKWSICFLREIGGFYPLLCFIAKKRVQKGSIIQNQETKKVKKKIERITHMVLAINQ
jgi:hypothetical protein